MSIIPVHPRIAHGGDHVQGVKLGIVLLSTISPKIFGHLAHAGTWGFPVRLRCTDTPIDTVDDIYRALVIQAKDLVSDGCRAIATNYRFLCPYQRDFATTLGVPCITSVLYQYYMVRAVVPQNKTIAIITTHMDVLDSGMLQSLDIPINVPVGTLDTAGDAGDNRQWTITNIIQIADDLCNTHTDIGAFLMESNDLSAYSHAVHHHTGLPVYDVYSLIDWFGRSLQPKNFGIPCTHRESHV